MFISMSGFEKGAGLKSDHACMQAVREGDLDPLGLLFERHHKHLYNFFLQQTGNPQTSEDLVQDVFYKMLKYRYTYRPESHFKTWMFTIAHNTKIDYYRKNRHKRNETELTDCIVSRELNPEEVSIDKDKKIHLLSALAALPEDKREVLILSRFQNMKYEEIAAITGCKVGTIKARVHWALKELAVLYQKRTGSEKT